MIKSPNLVKACEIEEFGREHVIEDRAASAQPKSSPASLGAERVKAAPY